MGIFQDETISAIATSTAPAGIGVVRLSGERSFDIANSIFRSASGRRIEKSRSIMHGHILDSKEKIIGFEFEYYPTQRGEFVDRDFSRLESGGL